MREIDCRRIAEVVRDLCIEGNCALRCDTVSALEDALANEESEIGQEVIEQLLKNAEVARRHRIPFCQDTGYAVLFIELGQGVRIVGGDLREAVNEGVRRGYSEGYLRNSLVRNPIDRVNTGDNTPATMNIDLVEGEVFEISLLVKGAGCDNMSAARMLTPAQGLQGAADFVVETVERAGPNASPPIVMGIGMGGPFAQAALLAQKALLWPVGTPNPDPTLHAVEEELVERINGLGIGPAGFGGRATVLGLHIESGATHIASFPVAVNIDCHSHRVATAEL